MQLRSRALHPIVRVRPVCFGIGVAVAVLAVASTPSAGLSATVGSAGAGSIEFYSVQGSRTLDGGCTVELQSQVRFGEIGTDVRAVAQDTATCTLTLQKKVLTNPVEPRDPGPGYSARRGSAQVSVGASSRQALFSSRAGTMRRADRVLAATPIHSAGFMQSWFYDPLGLTVNSVKNSVDWYWNGTQIVNFVTCGWEYFWLSQTSWALQENDAYCAINLTPNPTSGDSSSFVHYKNGVFCLGFDTHTWYDRNTARGDQVGTLWGFASWRWSGFCATAFLDIGYTIQRTLN